MFSVYLLVDIWISDELDVQSQEKLLKSCVWQQSTSPEELQWTGTLHQSASKWTNTTVNQSVSLNSSTNLQVITMSYVIECHMPHVMCHMSQVMCKMTRRATFTTSWCVTFT